MTPHVSIVIPNWNGRSFLARAIGATLQSAADCGLDCEIILVDDASTDGSDTIVAEQYPQVRLLRNTSNLGFGATSNRGAREARGEFLVLLNNDLIPRPEMIRELVRPLVETSDLFGVSGKTLTWDGQNANHVSMTAQWDGDRFALQHADPPTASRTLFLQGGSCAVRRAEFLRLGGFCELFTPGYWEDYDISYLAMKAGWRNLYNPAAVGHHLGQGSMVRAYGEEGVSLMKFRNELLFALLNITDRAMLREFTRRLPRRIAQQDAARLKLRLQALGQIIAALGKIVTERRRRTPFLKVGDQNLLAQFL